MWMWLLLLNLAAWSAAMSAHSVEAGLTKPDDTSAVSTTITAKKMTVRNQDSQAVFEGSVVLTRGSLIVYSDRMVVSFRPQENGSSTGDDRKAREGGKNGLPAKGTDSTPSVSNRAINQIVATGRVKIEKDTGSATCQKAVYYQNEEKIVLTGDPVAWDKGTRVSGKQITMFLAEDRSVVEGGSHVRIDPDGDQSK